MQGDVFALGRVYRNLLINAIQATAPGGDVAIATEATAERVRMRVGDTGCGIPPDRLGAIFDDFVTTKRRGLGLGLAISKKIVEQLGGQISVASEVGKGTTFVARIPARQGAADRARRRLDPPSPRASARQARTAGVDKNSAHWRGPTAGRRQGPTPCRGARQRPP